MTLFSGSPFQAHSSSLIIIVIIITATTTVFNVNFDVVTALDNGVGLTPPMGWLSWERFGCQTDCKRYPDTCISEALYLSQAQILVESGYRDVGYTYVNIDDCWSLKQRDTTTNKIVADPDRFPNGIKYLSQQFHQRGLKLGLYGDIGTSTCEGYPGFEGHFELDAITLAVDYEIDSIKVDTCNSNETLFNTTYPAFGKALNATGRHILYSCSWPNDYYELHHHYEDPDFLNHGIKQSCNIWRNYYDISDSWQSVTKIINFWARTSPEDVMIRAAGPGHFNDPDMLVVGNPGLSYSEQQTQFSLWSIFAAPLYISADLRTISEQSREILLNEEIIAINQDPLGRQGWCAEDLKSHFSRVWVRELVPTSATLTSSSKAIGSSDTWAVVLENYHSIFNAKPITFDLRKHLPNVTPQSRRMNTSIRSGNETWIEEITSFSVRDLITKQDLGVFKDNFTATVDESSVATFKIVLHHPQRLSPPSPSQQQQQIVE